MFPKSPTYGPPLRKYLLKSETRIEFAFYLFGTKQHVSQYPMDISPTVPRTMTGLVGARLSQVTQEEYLEDVNGHVVVILGETRPQAPEGHSKHGRRYRSKIFDTWRITTKYGS